MDWMRPPDPAGDGWRSNIKLDRISLIGAAIGYVGFLIYLILSVLGIVPEFSVTMSRRYNWGFMSDEACLAIMLLLTAAALVSWGYGKFPSFRRLFQRDEQ